MTNVLARDNLPGSSARDAGGGERISWVVMVLLPNTFRWQACVIEIVFNSHNLSKAFRTMILTELQRAYIE